jgi:hypothetical protein
MPSIVFINDEDFAPTITIEGTITARVYRVASPEIDGEVAVTGQLLITIPRPQPLLPLAGQITIQGTLTGSVRQPSGAFKDFAHYPFSGVDPAMAMIGVTSGALSSAATGSYSRPYAAFTAPADYPVSGGGYAWKRAAYAAVGFKFTSMTAGKHQILDAVQLESLPLGATGPTAYQTARSLNVVVKPTRLNYATNPNMESGITGYSVVSSATLAADPFCWRGAQALKVTVPTNPAADSGTSFSIPGLVPGRRYTMSARVAIAQDCGTVYPWCNSSNGTLVSRVNFTQAVPDPANRRWRTVHMTFDAKATTVSVGINVTKSSMPAGKTSIFWADAVLVEEGSSVRPYFDGSMGADYLWEAAGTTNLTRSYFYENRVERGYLVQTLLDENTPLGISAAAPRYAVLPNQGA